MKLHKQKGESMGTFLFDSFFKNNIPNLMIDKNGMNMYNQKENFNRCLTILTVEYIILYKYLNENKTVK